MPCSMVKAALPSLSDKDCTHTTCSLTTWHQLSISFCLFPHLHEEDLPLLCHKLCNVLPDTPLRQAARRRCRQPTLHPILPITTVPRPRRQRARPAPGVPHDLLELRTDRCVPKCGCHAAGHGGFVADAGGSCNSACLRLLCALLLAQAEDVLVRWQGEGIGLAVAVDRGCK